MTDRVVVADLRSYAAMKDSGVPWLGDVPEHWDVRRIKILFREKEERSGDGRGLLLSLTRARGLLPQSEASNRLASAPDLSKYKVCQPGDIVMNRMQAWSGMFAVSACEGLVSPDYSVFAAIGHSDVRFFEQLFKTPVVVDQFAQASKGIGSGFNRLYTPEFGAVPVVVPPLHEQAAIVRFLDYADRRIRRYIRAKQKLIKLLEEQKQAIIRQAVTRGRDPNVRLKPSGVEWLGDVPEHWEVVALRRRWSVTDCKHLTVPFVEDDDGIPLASVREVQSFELSLAQAKRTTREHYASLIEGGRKPHEGDLIYCRNVSVGAAAIVTTKQPLAMGQDVCLIRSRSESQRYLNYFMRSPAMRHQMAMLLVGSTFNRINVADIKALLVVVPPKSEQDEIAMYLDVETAELVRVQSLAANEISLLREYHTRLIADVVTGKLDVSEAAVRVPDAEEDLEISYAVGESADDEEVAFGNLDVESDEAEA